MVKFNGDKGGEEDAYTDRKWLSENVVTLYCGAGERCVRRYAFLKVAERPSPYCSVGIQRRFERY